MAAQPIVVRAGILALFIEGALWSSIRLFSFVYVLAQEVDLGAQHQTPGWIRLRFVAISVAVAVVLFLAGAAMRNGAGLPGRVAQVLAIAANIMVLVQGIAALVRSSGAEAVVAAACAAMLAVASLTALGLDLRAAVLGRGSPASAGMA